MLILDEACARALAPVRHMSRCARVLTSRRIGTSLQKLGLVCKFYSITTLMASESIQVATVSKITETVQIQARYSSLHSESPRRCTLNQYSESPVAKKMHIEPILRVASHRIQAKPIVRVIIRVQETESKPSQLYEPPIQEPSQLLCKPRPKLNQSETEAIVRAKIVEDAGGDCRTQFAVDLEEGGENYCGSAFASPIEGR